MMLNTQIFSLLTTAMTIAGLNLIGIKSAQAISLNTNLIVNGDAEDGSAGVNAYDVVSVPGWTTTSNLSVYRYNSDGRFPNFVSPGPVNRGNNFFGGGPANGFSNSSKASQTIYLSSGSEAIDSGNTQFDLSGFLGGYSIKQDEAMVIASFLDTNNVKLSSASIGPVTFLDRLDNTLGLFVTGLLARNTSGLVPIGTRSILVELNMSAAVRGGNFNLYYNDAYADNLALVLTDATPATSVPEPSDVPGLLIGGALVVGVIKKRQQKSS
jgi:hypothetical protein